MLGSVVRSPASRGLALPQVSSFPPELYLDPVLLSSLTTVPLPLVFCRSSGANIAQEGALSTSFDFFAQRTLTLTPFLPFLSSSDLPPCSLL